MRKMTADELAYQKRHPDALFCLDESLTKQSFKEECDVDEILRRAANGQDVSRSLNQRVAQYGDFSNAPDFTEAMNTVVSAQQAFMQLDWKLRERFHNSPAEFVAFCSDEKNRPEAESLGLVSPKPKPAPAGAGAGAAGAGFTPPGGQGAAQ